MYLFLLLGITWATCNLKVVENATILMDSENIPELADLVIRIEHENCPQINSIRSKILKVLYPGINHDLSIYEDFDRKRLLAHSDYAYTYFQNQLFVYNNNGGADVAVIASEVNGHTVHSVLASFLMILPNSRVSFVPSTKFMGFQNLRDLLVQKLDSLIPISTMFQLELNMSSNLCKYLAELVYQSSNEKSFWIVRGSHIISRNKCETNINEMMILEILDFNPKYIFENKSLVLPHNDINAPWFENLQKSVESWIRKKQGNRTDVFYYMVNCGKDVTEGIDKANCHWDKKVYLEHVYFANYTDYKYDGENSLANLDICCHKNTVKTVLQKFSEGKPSLREAMTKETNENAKKFVVNLMRKLNMVFCHGNCLKTLEQETGAKFTEPGGKYCWVDIKKMNLKCGAKKVYDAEVAKDHFHLTEK